MKYRPSPPARPASEVLTWLGSLGHRRHHRHANDVRRPLPLPLPKDPPSAPPPSAAGRAAISAWNWLLPPASMFSPSVGLAAGLVDVGHCQQRLARI